MKENTNTDPLHEAAQKVVSIMDHPGDDNEDDWDNALADLRAALATTENLRDRLTEDYCDCNYEPIRGIKAGRHLPSCRYGIIEDFLNG